MGFVIFATLLSGAMRLHELGHLRIALIAVFDAAQVAPVALGVLQERLEVGHTHHVHRAADLVRVEASRRPASCARRSFRP